MKEQIRCIRAIRVSLNACGRRIAMSTRKLSDGKKTTWYDLREKCTISICSQPHLFGYFLPSHRSYSPLYSLFEWRKYLKNMRLKSYQFIFSPSLKYQWIKIWGKMDNDIFFLFCLLMFYLPINAQEPSGSSAQAQKWNTDSTDATDLIFSRILYCLLDLNRIFLRLSARDFSYRK